MNCLSLISSQFRNFLWQCSFFSFMIGKTKAQCQRKYCARLKEKDEDEYLKDARERQKRNYIPVKRLRKFDIEQKSADIRELVRKSRAAAKQKVKEIREKEPVPVEMRLQGTVATTNWRRTLLRNIEASWTMFVKLNFSQPKKGESTKKQKRLSADRKRKEIQKLKCENESLKRKTEDFIGESKDKKQCKPKFLHQIYLKYLHLRFKISLLCQEGRWIQKSEKLESVPV